MGYNEHFPKRRVKTKYNNRKPWLSEGLKLSIGTKNKLYLTYVKLKCLRNELRYKSYRNKLNHTLRIAERNYCAELLAKHKSNLKKVWGVLKSIVNKNKAKRVQEKFKVHDDSVITDRDVISTRFNDYFIEIGPNLAKKKSRIRAYNQNFTWRRLWSIQCLLNPWLMMKYTRLSFI